MSELYIDENEWNLDENDENDDKVIWIMGDSEMKFKSKKISQKNEIKKETTTKTEIYTLFGS